MSVVRIISENLFFAKHSKIKKTIRSANSLFTLRKFELQGGFGGGDQNKGPDVFGLQRFG